MNIAILFGWSVLDTDGVALEDVSKGLRGDGNATCHELGNIIAAHELPMVVGIFAGQLKGFRGLAVLVDMGKERTCESPIVAAAAENDPTAITRP